MCFSPSEREEATPDWVKAFSRMKGAMEVQPITFNRFPNVAEMRPWMNELKLKCVKGATDPNAVVDWLGEVELSNNKWEDFGSAGRLYDPKYQQLDTRILEGLEKILSGEFRRQIENIKDAWLIKRPVEVITGRLVIKRIFDRNKVSAQDWHLVDYDRLKTIELQNDNLSKFMEDWNYCLRHSSCRFTEECLEEHFLKQVRKSSRMKQVLVFYDFRAHFEGAPKS